MTPRSGDVERAQHPIQEGKELGEVLVYMARRAALMDLVLRGAGEDALQKRAE